MSYLICEEPVAGYIVDLFISNPASRHQYHNLLQTIKTVRRVKEIASFYQLSQSDLCTIVIAAWFHDVGYLAESGNGPEKRSIRMLVAYMNKQHTSISEIERACNCIIALNGSPNLSRLTETILCDAATYEYGTLYFREMIFNEKATMEFPNENDFQKWKDGKIWELSNHIYFTEYCQLRLNRRKMANLRWIRSLRFGG